MLSQSRNFSYSLLFSFYLWNLLCYEFSISIVCISIDISYFHHVSEIELHNKLSTIKELSRQLQTLVRILERKLSKFLHEYIAAVANGAKSIKKERSIIVPENDMYESSEEEDDWKVVLPSSSATATQGDTQSKGWKNKKTKRANKGKGRKK